MFIEATRFLQFLQLQPQGFHAHDLLLGRGTIRVYEGGQGPDLLILHGAQGSAMEHIGWMLPTLGKYYHIIAPDIPGMAESRSVLTMAEANIPYIASLLHTMLDKLGVREPMRIAGGSMGGWIAVRMVLQRPDRFSRMVLGCPAGLPIQLPLEEAAKAIVPETIDQLKEGFRYLMRKVPNVPRWLLADILATFRTHNSVLREALKGDHHLTEEELRSITIPTMIFWGDRDELIPVENGRMMASLMPNAKLVIIPECSHAFIVDARDLCLPGFLAGLREPGEAAIDVAVPTGERTPGLAGTMINGLVVACRQLSLAHYFNLANNSTSPTSIKSNESA